MARLAAVLGRDIRPCDRLGVAAVCRCFGKGKVDAALVAASRSTKRRRELPAEVTIYYVIAMALFMHVNQKEVLRCLLEGLRSVTGGEGIRITGKSGISQARTRLGSEPLRCLYQANVGPIATKRTQGAWYRGWRLVSLDGTTLDLPDERVNRDMFGGPSTYNDRSPFPQIRFVSLAEVGTRVLFGAEMAGYRTSEVELARSVVKRLKAGMLCLADRGYFGCDLFEKAVATGADLLWRARKNNVLPVVTVLPDGSYLSQLTTWRRQQRGAKGGKGLPVRVVEYRLDGVENKDQIYRLVTTILDPERAPADELAALYLQRWEIETAFDELKTHLRGARVSLRSKTPDLVRQEFFGLLLAHFTVRQFMHEAALEADEDPDRLSFTHSLHVIRRKIGRAGAVPP